MILQYIEKYYLYRYFLFTMLSVAWFPGMTQDKSIIVTDWVNEPALDDMKKPLLFVDFWATWCIPCIHAMPQTALLKEEFGDDVLFVYISDEAPGKVKNFMKKHDMHFYSAIDNTGSNHVNYNVKTLPYSILMDYNGNVIWQGQPVELKRNALQKYVDKNRGNVGSVNRLKFSSTIYLKDNWQIFTAKRDTLQYMEKVSVSNTYTVDRGEHYFSGDIKYIISMAFNIPVNNIVSELKVDKKYIIKCNVTDDDEFKTLLRKFLKNECNIEIKRTHDVVDAYVIDGGDVQRFLSTSYQDFEMGNNSYLADDMNVKIDNATIIEMTNILSDLSDFRFFYTGKNNNRYDWEIHYKFNNLTIEQLESELGFSLANKNIEMEFLHLSYPDEN